MTYKELDKKREKVLKDLATRQEAIQSFKQVTNRIIDDINEQQEELRIELVKRIRKHFKGITLNVTVNSSHLLISYNDVEFLDYRVGHTSYQGMTRKLAEKIINEYEEVYGEVEGYTSCGMTQMITNGDFANAVNDITACWDGN